jgi:hypothetical protein
VSDDSATTQPEPQLDDLSESVAEIPVKLKEELAAFESAIDRIPSPDPPPRTTLQLQGRADSEGAWQSYLRYFLDPTEPHGLGTDALNYFLQGFADHVEESIPDYAPETITVSAERQTDQGNRPDLLVISPGQFFICCELKLYAQEGSSQTHRYVADPQIAGFDKDDFPEMGHHYLYVKRPGHSDASAPAFTTVTWRDIHEWFTPLLDAHQGRYPARTVAQLTDFLDTIHQDMTDDEHLKTEREKMALYFDHQDAIREALDGLETVYEHETENWRCHFLEDYQPKTWDEDWHCNSNQYGQIYHSEWRQDDGLALEDSNVRMHFVHLIRNIESFRDGQLTMQLRWPGESSYRERFKELFVSERFADDLDPILGEYDIQKRADYSYNNPRFIEKEYSVVKTELPESYYETLSQAVREHQQLAPVINEMLETAIRDVES